MERERVGVEEGDRVEELNGVIERERERVERLKTPRIAK